MTRPRGFHTARLTDRVWIQEAVETQDDTGQPVVSWKTFLSREPAEFIPTGGQETLRGKQLEAGTRAIFVVRAKHGYNEQMSVLVKTKCGEQRYGITYINPVGGGNRYLELVCKT